MGGGIRRCGQWRRFPLFLALMTIGTAEPAARAEVVVQTARTRGIARAACVPKAPAIDGTLDDPLWQQAPELELGQTRNDEPSALATVARVLFDERNIYIGIECADPTTRDLVADQTQRDSDFTGDDRVEVYLSPDMDRGYRHLCVNPRGAFADIAYRVNDVAVKGWDSQAIVRTQVRDGQGWTATLAIPLAACDAYVGNGLTWGINIARHRPARGGQHAMTSSWAIMPLNDLHQPHAFGRLSGITIPERPDGVTQRRAKPAEWPREVGYLREEIQIDEALPDEACRNLQIVNSRWPNCYNNETAIRDIFRLEGVEKATDHEKALALWKWFRILVSPGYGGYCYEADAGGTEGIVLTSHKIFTVYGHHMCDGQSWAYVPLWRAAGYMALDECHWGHTIASLRYKDADGQYRYHDFDPQLRYYWWDKQQDRVATWTVPLLHGLVHRHLREPRYIHNLRTSLRLGEVLERTSDNEGNVIQAGELPAALELKGGYVHRPGRTDGVYAMCGQETQTVVANTAPEHFDDMLMPGSTNVACSPAGEGTAALHPAKAGEPACFIYRVPSPFVAVNVTCEATLVRSSASDRAELSLSTDDGLTWTPFHTLDQIGRVPVRVDLGAGARAAGKPSLYTAYEFLIKAEFQSEDEPAGVGMDDLKISAFRQLNKRTLPNLMPGENVIRVSADRLAPGHLLEVQVEYSLDGESRTVTKHIDEFPFYFAVDTGEFEEKWPDRYDGVWDVGRLRTKAFRMRLISADDTTADESLPVLQAAQAFRRAYPHPVVTPGPKVQTTPETDGMQTSGFFPQSTRALHEPEAMAKLMEACETADGPEKCWIAIEQLGDYPDAIDFLLARVPQADGDELLHLCKALAQIRNPRAIEPLLARWQDVPEGSPGTRYIPDVLAAIGDPRVVPDLVRPLKGLRFDHRFHIARSLGVLGGDVAVRTLRDIASNDPFPAVRELAHQMLRELETRATARSR